MPEPTQSLIDMARWVADESALFTDEGTPFRAQVAEGDPRVLVVTGENASGKSLWFRILGAAASRDGVLPVSISIRERAGSGSGEMSGLRRVMMFGEEQEQSTGATSVTAIRNAFENNLDRDQPVILGLDEPELGLSQGYAAALGRYIGQQARTIPDSCVGVVVVSHSRPLVGELIEGLGAVPTHVSVGGAANLDGWLREPEERTVEDLLALADVGLERFRWAASRLRG